MVSDSSRPTLRLPLRQRFADALRRGFLRYDAHKNRNRNFVFRYCPGSGHPALVRHQREREGSLKCEVRIAKGIDWCAGFTLPCPFLPLRASEVLWVLIDSSMVFNLPSFKLHPSHFTLPSCPSLGWCLSGHGSLAARSLIIGFVPILNDRRPCRHGHHAAASVTAVVLILPRSTNHRPNMFPPLKALRPASIKSGGKNLGPV
jgi:hypothetical protein